MSQVTVGENEGIESALRRFKRSVARPASSPTCVAFATMKHLFEKYKRKLKQALP